MTLQHIWHTIHVLILDFKDGKVIFSIIWHENLCTLFISRSCTHDMPITVVVTYSFKQHSVDKSQETKFVISNCT